jgi:hypothetical protein
MCVAGNVRSTASYRRSSNGADIKGAPPKRQAQVLDRHRTIAVVARDLGLVKQNLGNWAWHGRRIGRGEHQDLPSEELEDMAPRSGGLHHEVGRVPRPVEATLINEMHTAVTPIEHGDALRLQSWLCKVPPIELELRHHRSTVSRSRQRLNRPHRVLWGSQTVGAASRTGSTGTPIGIPWPKRSDRRPLSSSSPMIGGVIVWMEQLPPSTLRRLDNSWPDELIPREMPAP